MLVNAVVMTIEMILVTLSGTAAVDAKQKVQFRRSVRNWIKYTDSTLRSRPEVNLEETRNLALPPKG